MAEGFNTKLHLPVIIEQDENSVYIVSCPLFKGCHSYGSTVDEAMSNIYEVVEMSVDENKPDVMNKFIGFREIEVTAN
jgi:predicted RNase H-like HicB family nuclease